MWVSGKKPKGSGWELDASLKRDTGRWIEVVGKISTVNGITYVRAVQVALATRLRRWPRRTRLRLPAGAAEGPAGRRVRAADGRRKRGAQDSRFTVQFSKDMDETTFAGNVMLRYRGACRPATARSTASVLSYDPGRRALTVDPRDVLRNGRAVELLLLPGIRDMDGLPLEGRPGTPLSMESWTCSAT